MKRFLVLSLVLTLLLTSTAFAFDPARFSGIEGISVEYDPAVPTVYSVTAGFNAHTAQMGGQMLVRYKSPNPEVELPLILLSFTSAGSKVTHMNVRTDRFRYAVTCSDLAGNGLTAVDSEGVVLISEPCLAMLKDMASSSFVHLSLWEADPSATFHFVLPGASRAMLQMFINEYEAHVMPMITEGSTLATVYEKLAPEVEALEVSSVKEDAYAILSKEFPTLTVGSRNNEVMQLQQALFEMGLTEEAADGIYGKNTAAAVKAFQTASGLKPTGEADDATQTAVFMTQLAARS